MHNQGQSRLLSLPLEVRDAIYAYIIPDAFHVLTRQGRFAFTRCLNNENERLLTGDAKRSTEEYPTTMDNLPSENLWRRRSLSSWGPHFQCEGTQTPAAKNSDSYRATMAMLLSCKKM